MIVFDVNETLSDLSPMADRFADVGLPGELSRLWFASVLRDGFALAVTGNSARFATVAEGVLRTMLPAGADADAAVEHVLAGFAALPVHPDVPAGVRALQAAGHRLVTLSNGASSVAQQLLARAGLADAFAQLLSVEDAGAWKPDPRAYGHAARSCGVPVDELVLVAVHPWDVDGAARAGLRTAWLDRAGTAYPGHFHRPDHTARTLAELVPALHP